MEQIEEVQKIENAQQILDIILPIPKEKFTTYEYGDRDGRSCFLGHIHRKLSPDGKDDYMGDMHGYGARDLTKRFLRAVHKSTLDGTHVNNGPNVNGYTEDNPKDRVVHMLQDMIEHGY